MPTPLSHTDAPAVRRSPSPESFATILPALLVALALVMAAAASLAQADPEQTATTAEETTPDSTDEIPSEESEAVNSDGVPPSGSASVLLAGRSVGQLHFTIRPDGPRFALAPLAQLLGIELRTGPLGDMHVLLYADKEIRFGPEELSYVVAQADGSEEIRTLPRRPVKGLNGLMVPREALEIAFGDELGYDFTWDFQRLELRIDRAELREIEASLDLIHQYRVSTVEMVFAQKPRYRFVRVEGGVEIRFVGDHVLVDDVMSQPDDPLVRGLVMEPTRLRIQLVENAAAAEPRLVSGGGVHRLVLDIYRQRASQATPPGEEIPALAQPSADRGGIRTIVLDPGHGGDETGAIGRGGTIEAALTLRVARLLMNRIEQRLPVRVLLTRDTDVDIPHDTRVAIANQNKADLFISLHFNSYHGSRARGAETYFLSREASDQIAEEALAAEHASMTEAERREMADLELILWDLAQSFHLSESQRFANLVQEELNLELGLRDRGVRQAPFRVLMGASMPAVLVELGFLSNPAEEEKLQSAAYLGQLVDSLVRAITRFKTQMDARSATSDGIAPGEGGP